MAEEKKSFFKKIYDKYLKPKDTTKKEDSFFKKFFTKCMSPVVKILPIFLPFTITKKLKENSEIKKTKKSGKKDKEQETPQKTESIFKRFRSSVKAVGNTINPLSGKHGILPHKDKKIDQSKEH